MTDTARPLPRGRHQLSRDEVVNSQRERIFAAMAAAMQVNGYVATSVADVIRGAGVSRETFYQQFSSKQDCFSAAFDAAAGALFGSIDRVEQVEGGGRAQMTRLLGVYLESLSRRPDLARLYLLEVYAAGPEALRRRAEVQQQFVDLTARLMGARSRRDRFACEALVAATSAMVTTRLAADDIRGLRELRDPLAALAEELFPSGVS